MLLCRRSPATGPSTCCFFFFNDTATTEIYTLSLHDALPISQGERAFFIGDMTRLVPQQELPYEPRETATPVRSEEHTSELQSRPHLVCRLLLEKKKTTRSSPEPRVRTAGRER